MDPKKTLWSLLGLGFMMFVIQFSVIAKYNVVQSNDLMNPSPQVIATIAVESFPSGVAVNSETNRIYVTHRSSNTLSVIDGAINSVITTIPIENGPNNLDVNPVTNKVYVTNSIYTNLTVIDGETNTVIAVVPTNAVDVAVNPETNRIYTTTDLTNPDYYVQVIDGETDTIIANPTDPFPPINDGVGLEVNPVTNIIYVSAMGQIELLNGDTNTFFEYIPNIAIGINMAVNANTNRIYHVNSNIVGGHLYVIDGVTNEVTEVVLGDSVFPQKVRVNPVANQVLVSDYRSKVWILDGETNTISHTVPLTNNTKSFDINALTNRIYVANANEPYLWVISYGSCPQDSWFAEYYDNTNLLGVPVYTGCQSSVSSYWGSESPDDRIPADNFSARWTRDVEFTETGLYKFRTFSDDGVRLYVDGNKLIDDWTSHSFLERSATSEILEGFHTISLEYFEESGEAMAYLNWYLCPNGETDCDLHISPQYQTNYLNDPMPTTCTTEPNQTIARWGCLITSISMAMQRYGINTTPKNLNDWLSGEHPETGMLPRGYADICDGNLLWDEILEYASSVHGKNLEWVRTNNASHVLRNEDVPVIMRVAGGGHFTLAVDVAKDEAVDTVGINDPHHAWACFAITASPPLPPSSVLHCNVGDIRHATTELEEDTYRGHSVPDRYLREREGERTSSLQFLVTGAEILLTDSTGRNVGLDRSTGGFLLEIPNSFYYDSEIVPPGAEPNSILERVLYLPQDAAGSYTLQIFGPGFTSRHSKILTSEYDVSIFGFDAQFMPTVASVSGSIAQGSVLEYDVSFVPGQSLDITYAGNVYLPAILKIP